MPNPLQACQTHYKHARPITSTSDPLQARQTHYKHATPITSTSRLRDKHAQPCCVVSTDLEAPNAVHRKNISLVSKGNRKEHKDVRLWHQSGRELLARARGSCQRKRKEHNRKSGTSPIHSGTPVAASSTYVDLLDQFVDKFLAMKLLSRHIEGPLAALSICSEPERR